MRTLNQLPIVQDSGVNFPYGTIKNETDTEDGTPVVREIYGDVLTNIYKLLETVGITATGDEDSNASQYQIIDALKKLPNSLNDIEQVLTLTGTVFSVPLNTSYLPNKYFFIARASDGYVSGVTYTFEDSENVSFPFSSDGFNASDEVLVIIDSLGVRAYSLSFLSGSSNEVFTVMGTPVSYNSTNIMYYLEDGSLLTDLPSANGLEAIIRVDLSDGTIVLNDVVILNNMVLCLCYKPSTFTYFFRRFNISNLTVSLATPITGTSFATASDFMPYIFARGSQVYVTNNMNANANDYTITRLDFSTGTDLSFISNVDLDVSFIKTSNTVLKGTFIYTLVDGVFEKFHFSTGVKTSVATYNGVTGQIFGFNGEVYFTSGEVAKKWQI